MRVSAFLPRHVKEPRDATELECGELVIMYSLHQELSDFGQIVHCSIEINT
jgi:hypothetical protein